MELNQLRYFQKVARTQNVTKAARELYISQPSLSQSLSRLESSLGCPLFVHQQGKKLQLNDAGILFLEKVDRALQELEEGINIVRELNNRANVQVSVASSIYDLCNEIVLSYFEYIPNVRISQKLVQINSLTELLLNDEVDFAISPCPLADMRLDCYPLYTEELLAVVGPGHRLYGRREVDREELIHERFICNYSEADRYYLLDVLFGEEHSDLDIMLESNEPNTIQRLVDRGAGVAFMPARIVMRRFKTDPQTLNRAIRVRGYSFDAPTCLSVKKHRYLMRSASDFYDYVIEFCRKESEMSARFIQEYFGN